MGLVLKLYCEIRLRHFKDCTLELLQQIEQ